MDPGQLPLIRPGDAVLFVRLKSLGDLLLSTALAAALKRSVEGLSIAYVVDEPFAGVCASFPSVDEEFVRPKSWSGRARLAARLWNRFDLALDLHGSRAAGFLARAAARRGVVGVAGRGGSVFHTRSVADAAAARHTVEATLDFAEALGLTRPGPGPLELAASAGDVEAWRGRLGTRSALLHPGGRFPHKLWPAERFERIAARLEADGYRVHVLLGPGEIAPPPLSLRPAVSSCPPGQLAALMKAVDLFVGNDSGPMHFAAAAGCRTVGIFGPSDPVRWRPWSERSVVVAAACTCAPGSQEPCRTPDRWCLAALPFERVMTAIRAAEDRP